MDKEEKAEEVWSDLSDHGRFRNDVCKIARALILIEAHAAGLAGLAEDEAKPCKYGHLQEAAEKRAEEAEAKLATAQEDARVLKVSVDSLQSAFGVQCKENAMLRNDLELATAKLATCTGSLVRETRIRADLEEKNAALTAEAGRMREALKVVTQKEREAHDANLNFLHLAWEALGGRDSWQPETTLLEAIADCVGDFEHRAQVAEAETWERAARVAEGGGFLHEESLEAKWGKECAAAIRREAKKALSPSQPAPEVGP